MDHPEIAAAERSCTDAIASTDPAFRQYITLIPQRKNVGTKEKPKWISVRLPYMAVDGRIAMATAEHRQAEGTLNISTIFREVGETMLCQADVLSSLLGAATGHSQVNIGGGGIDKTNPFENAETSAIGRALGFLGYGLFGNGIASADEVVNAQAKREAATPTPQGQHYATAVQVNALLGLAERHGLTARLNKAITAKKLNIQQLPMQAYRILLKKMQEAVPADDGSPDYEAFERQARDEAAQARAGNADPNTGEIVDDPEDAAFIAAAQGTLPGVPTVPEKVQEEF